MTFPIHRYTGYHRREISINKFTLNSKSLREASMFSQLFTFLFGSRNISLKIYGSYPTLLYPVPTDENGELAIYLFSTA